MRAVEPGITFCLQLRNRVSFKSLGSLLNEFVYLAASKDSYYPLFVYNMHEHVHVHTAYSCFICIFCIGQPNLCMPGYMHIKSS